MENDKKQKTKKFLLTLTALLAVGGATAGIILAVKASKDDEGDANKKVWTVDGLKNAAGENLYFPTQEALTKYINDVNNADKFVFTENSVSVDYKGTTYTGKTEDELKAKIKNAILATAKPVSFNIVGDPSSLPVDPTNHSVSGFKASDIETVYEGTNDKYFLDKDDAIADIIGTKTEKWVYKNTEYTTKTNAVNAQKTDQYSHTAASPAHPHTPVEGDTVVDQGKSYTYHGQTSAMGIPRNPATAVLEDGKFIVINGVSYTYRVASGSNPINNTGWYKTSEVTNFLMQVLSPQDSSIPAKLYPKVTGGIPSRYELSIDKMQTGGYVPSVSVIYFPGWYPSADNIKAEDLTSHKHTLSNAGSLYLKKGTTNELTLVESEGVGYVEEKFEVNGTAYKTEALALAAIDKTEITQKITFTVNGNDYSADNEADAKAAAIAAITINDKSVDGITTDGTGFAALTIELTPGKVFLANTGDTIGYLTEDGAKEAIAEKELATFIASPWAPVQSSVTSIVAGLDHDGVDSVSGTDNSSLLLEIIAREHEVKVPVTTPVNELYK